MWSAEFYPKSISLLVCTCFSMNRQGECYRHAMVCGAGIGVFLMLRVSSPMCWFDNSTLFCTSDPVSWVRVPTYEQSLPLNKSLLHTIGRLVGLRSTCLKVVLFLQRTNILLQRCERQAMWPSPYLDAFGEEVSRLKRCLVHEVRAIRWYQVRESMPIFYNLSRL